MTATEFEGTEFETVKAILNACAFRTERPIPKTGPFGEIEDSAFGQNLRTLFFTEQPVRLEPGEHDYFVYWKFNKVLDMSPREVDEMDPETRNAFWVMMKYEEEKAEHDAFKRQSQAFHNKK
jgi:hypothetical protein